MKFLFHLLLVIILIAGCTQQIHSTPRYTSQTHQNVCKGTARCFNGTITRIVDGDTLDIDNVPIRLALVDAPDYNKGGGGEAADFVSSICQVGSAALADEDDGQNESYGRIVAVVYCNNMNINAELLYNGKATLYEEFCSVSEFANENWTGC